MTAVRRVFTYDYFNLGASESNQAIRASEPEQIAHAKIAKDGKGVIRD